MNKANNAEFMKNIKDVLEAMSHNGRFHRRIMEDACERLEQAAKDLEDVRLELSTPLTMDCAQKKEPLYKWAATIVCEGHRLRKQLEQAAALEEIHTDLVESQAGQIGQQRWIPVSERLPEEREDAVPFRSEDVFVTNGLSARKAYWMTRQKHWRFYGIGWPNPITHWKPIILPTPEENKPEVILSETPVIDGMQANASVEETETDTAKGE